MSDNTKIQWGIVPFAPEYQVSTTGKVKRNNKELRPMRSKSGHLYVFIHSKKKWIHHLVLLAFGFQRPFGAECRHMDGNPQNNALENLLWGTHAENSSDRWRHGTMPIPHQSVFTKLIPEDIPVVRVLAKSGLSSRAIGAKFNTSHTTIQKIVRGERWKGY